MNQSLRNNPDGSCNCRPLGGACFFTDIVGGPCDCKCHKITQGKYTLKHSILDTEWGKENFFELTFIETEGEKKGMLICVPFTEPFKVQISNVILPKVPQKYTVTELRQMLSEAISNFEAYYLK